MRLRQCVFAAAELDPADAGGTIVSLDQPRPPGAWRWGGPDWERRAARGDGGLVEVAVEAPGATRDTFALGAARIRLV